MQPIEVQLTANKDFRVSLTLANQTHQELYLVKSRIGVASFDSDVFSFDNPDIEYNGITVKRSGFEESELSRLGPMAIITQEIDLAEWYSKIKKEASVRYAAFHPIKGGFGTNLMLISNWVELTPSAQNPLPITPSSNFDSERLMTKSGGIGRIFPLVAHKPGF